MKRIGQGKSKLPRGKDNRIDLYAIYDNGLCQYEGCEADRDEERWTIGLALGGPNAAHLQPYVELKKIEALLDVKYF